MKILDGNKNASNSAYKMSEISFVYPITPSSPMAEHVSELADQEEKNIFDDTVKVVEMQSEAGAIGAMHGALLTGSLATSFTSSQGLLLMIPNMYKIAGECLPGVLHVASRTVATHALSIFGDHSDIYQARDTGWCMLSSSNVEDAGLLAYVAHLSSIKGSLPFIHFFDGFRTSHEVNKVNTLNDISDLVDYDAINKFKSKMLINDIHQNGTNQNEDIYFQSLEARNNLYNEMPNIVNDYMAKINEKMGTNYKPFVYYGDPYATNVIVAMGSVCDTVKITVDELNKKDHHVGLIEVHLYRPFSTKYLLDVLPKTTHNIAVLDKAKSIGANGEPLYLDVLSALNSKDINIVGGRYGISGKNTTPGDILAVYNMLNDNLKNNFTLGIEDDVTNLSLAKVNYDFKYPYNEIRIYGFGSDGMVSASKDIVNILGEDSFVQNYNQYDSKKSGGVTISNIRYANVPINAPFYVENPDIVVITKDSYIGKYHMLDGIKDNGILVINTDNDIDKLLVSDIKSEISSKKLKVYTIDADKIALEAGIKGKINKVMETVILHLLNIDDYQNKMINEIKNEFATKGEDVIEANIKVISSSISGLKEYNVNLNYDNVNLQEYNKIEKIDHRMGDTLKVSELLEYRTGSFPCGLAKDESRQISKLVPKWNKNLCVECNMCSLVCPHGVIRPYISNDDTGKTVPGREGLYYNIEIREDRCTGCGLCINTCLAHGLTFGEFDNNTNQRAKLWEKRESEKIFPTFTIKGSQFEKPHFINPGACAGCGETPYIKLLSQLFRDKLVIANATGCSSIYGGSVPSTPYDVSWANSLFEDNAEFGYGMYLSYTMKRNRLIEYVKNHLNELEPSLEEWLNYLEDYDKCLKISNELNTNDKFINDNKEYLLPKTFFIIGGDGWAYDIGFGGLDHVLSSNANVNILVLDTEVYSNTGGQASKSSPLGVSAKFQNMGKKTSKKDLFKFAMSYPNCYVASISFGANYAQTIKAFEEATLHDGPSIIIAYAPCIEHGIKGGMINSINEEKLVVESGYNILMRYNPSSDKLTIDSKEPDFTKYDEIFENENRYRSLKIKNKEEASELLKLNKEDAIKRYQYYANLCKEKNN